MTSSPPCRKCGDPSKVICWPPERPQDTVCPDCCDDHEYSHARGEGWTCDHCGIEPPPDFYDYDD